MPLANTVCITNAHQKAHWDSLPDRWWSRHWTSQWNPQSTVVGSNVPVMSFRTFLFVVVDFLFLLHLLPGSYHLESECSHERDQSFPTSCNNVPASESSRIKFRMECPGFRNCISNTQGMAFCNLLPLRSVQMPERLLCTYFSGILFLSPFCLCSSGKGVVCSRGRITFRLRVSWMVSTGQKGLTSLFHNQTWPSVSILLRSLSFLLTLFLPWFHLIQGALLLWVPVTPLLNESPV